MSAVHNVVDFMLPIPDDATAACFTQLPGRLGLQQSTGPAAKGTSSWRKLVAYARTSNIRFEWPLTGLHLPASHYQEHSLDLDTPAQ